MKTPLNQTYKQNTTFEDFPDIEKRYKQLVKFSLDNNFVYNRDGRIIPRGRNYDTALLSQGVDFNNKIVCELGARDGIFGSWLTQFASKVYVSDYFQLWGDLGDFEHWKKIWNDAAYNPDRLVSEHQDLMKLTYPNNFFDIVVCTSVIEHTFPQNEYFGDMTAIREIARITKPGGIILLSTDLADKTQWVSGTLFYSKLDLFDRIINPSKCHLRGPYDFELDHPDNTDVYPRWGLMTSSVVFSLQKPLPPQPSMQPIKPVQSISRAITPSKPKPKPKTRPKNQTKNPVSSIKVIRHKTK